MSSEIVDYWYECRMCEEKFIEGSDTYDNALDKFLRLYSGRNSLLILVNYHNCTNNNVGLADLIGFIKRDDTNLPTHQ